MEKKTKTISVMLDIQGTCDGIDGKQIELFVKQLECLKEKFDAEECIISISTHYRETADIRHLIRIIAPFLPKGIRLGLNFFSGGTYLLDTDETTMKGFMFNSNKIETFINYIYSLENIDNKWMAVIDDSFSTDTYKYHRDIHPMLIGRPSQKNYKSSKDNFMSIGTETVGFMGVLEIFDKYINSIKNIDAADILDTQKNMMCHLSGSDLWDIIRDKNFNFIEQYFLGGFADEDDYRDILIKIGFILGKEELTKEELVVLKRIFVILNNKFVSVGDVDNINRLNELQKTFK